MTHHRLTARARPGFRSAEPEAVRIWLLGGFRASVGSRIVKGNRWRLRKAASLVKLLALAEGHRLHREQITDALWPDLDAGSASNNLHRVLHFARGLLEAAPENTASRYLQLRGDLLFLCPEGQVWVDVDAFEGAAATARYSREPAAYRAAVELYAGELLPEDRYEEWTAGRREELRRLYLDLLTEMAALHEERGEYGPAIEALEQVVAEEPTREEAHASLMRLYVLSGKRSEALRQYDRVSEALRQEFGTEPDATSRHLYEDILAGRVLAARSPPPGSPLKEPADAGKHNLPGSLTSFVGREREMLEVKRELGMSRLLTLTGPGGSGKTRLALEVARELVGAYTDGVWLVELASLADPELVPQVLAAALEVRQRPDRTLVETLTEALREKDLLLVLDNCEHLVDACAHLAETLLSSCPRLRILNTSREALGVAGEVNLPVPPLSLPDPALPLTVEGLEGYGSARLFVERAMQRPSAFALTSENARAVVEICQKLEGIPLAIELAAARVGALAVEQIAQRLDDSLNLLTGGDRTATPRQRTLRGSLDWSHELLDGPEQVLFRRLSVFAGGWTLAAAEAVGSGSGIEESEVLDLLSGLMNKSLVVRVARDESRYGMLEPIRQYAREKLEESGEANAARHRHATLFLALAEEVEPELTGAHPVAWLERLELERGNLRTALSWILDADEESGERAEMGLRLAAALGRFWDAYGPDEGRRWLEKGLACSDASPTSVRAKALNEAGFIAVYEGDPQAMALLEEGLALYKELGDKSGVASAISNLGHAVVHVGPRERMMSLREEVEALLSEPLDRRVRAHLLLFLGFAAASEGDFEQMRVRLEEGLALFRESEDIRGVATCLPSIGMIVLVQGDSERAAALFEEGLLLQRELKYKTAIFFGLMGMAGVAALQGQPARTAKLMGASEALREAIGLSLAPLASARYDYEGYLATARAGLDEAAFETAWSEGCAMSPEQAIEYALSTEDPAPPTASGHQRVHTDKPTDILTRREREVAILIGRGLTNRQIADELDITERTVETHVSKILRKLGLRSRTQIATRMIEQGQLSTEPG